MWSRRDSGYVLIFPQNKAVLGPLIDLRAFGASRLERRSLGYKYKLSLPRRFGTNLPHEKALTTHHLCRLQKPLHTYLI